MPRLLPIAAIVIALLAGAAPSAPAAAQEKFDMIALSCGELLEGHDQGQKQADEAKGPLYWFAGYYSPEEQSTVVDRKAIETDIAKIIAQCREQPKIGVMTTAAKFMGKNATAPGSDAEDLAILTCKKMVEVNKSGTASEKFNATAGLLWLLGRHANRNKTTVFGGWATSMEKYCAENPEMSLVTMLKVMVSEVGK